MTSFALVTAAILTIVIGVVHSWLGEVRLIGPLVSAKTSQGILAKSAFARGVLRFAWHLTSIAWWGLAAMMWELSSGPIAGHDRVILAIIGLMFLATGATTLIASRGRHLAWIVFLAIAGLSVVPLLPAAQSALP